MKRTTQVFAKAQFEALHYWPSAPAGTGFLASIHRHVFHVELSIDVQHYDREIEFIELKHDLSDFVRNGLTDDQRFPPSLGVMSCEDIADEILTYFERRYPGRAMFCEVSEDGENGASVWLEEDE